MAGGFRLVGDVQANDMTGKLGRFYVASGHSTLLAPGDLVALTGTGDVDGVPAVDAATAGTGNSILGAITDVEPNYSDLEQKGLPANTAGYVWVITDPYAVYEAEVSTSIAVTDINQNAPIVATAATLSGNMINSNMKIDSTGFVSTTEQVRIISLLPGGPGTGVTVRCMINEHDYKETAGN